MKCNVWTEICEILHSIILHTSVGFVGFMQLQLLYISGWYTSKKLKMAAH